MTGSEKPARKTPPAVSGGHVGRGEIFSGIGALTEACGTEHFPHAIYNFLSHVLDVTEFTALTFHHDAAPVLLFTSIRDHDADLQRYSSGLYVLDPFYEVYRNGQLDGFAAWDEIAPDNYKDAIRPYLNYMKDWGALDEVGYIFQLTADTAIHISFVSPPHIPVFDADARSFGNTPLYRGH